MAAAAVAAVRVGESPLSVSTGYVPGQAALAVGCALSETLCSSALCQAFGPPLTLKHLALLSMLGVSRSSQRQLDRMACSPRHPGGDRPLSASASLAIAAVQTAIRAEDFTGW